MGIGCEEQRCGKVGLGELANIRIGGCLTGGFTYGSTGYLG